MIASLTGEVAQIGLDSVVLTVNGVGYKVFATLNTLAELRHGQQAVLFTSLVVREDSLTLFGFLSGDEREMYESLQTVSGVGPKLALAMLAVHSPDELRRAVADEDLPALQRVPGVGPKSAKRLVLELAGKLGEPTSVVEAEKRDVQGHAARDDVISALVGLGWSQKVAENGVEQVLREADPNIESAALLRTALVTLGGNKNG